jgi:hypothetical protein
MSYLPCCYLYISFISCTSWVPTISVLNLAIFPCYSNLLLRRRRWTGILRWWVLGYVLPRLPFLWCYGVFCCFVPLRVVLIFRDIIHVITIIYSWHLVICEHFWLYVWNNWSWVMHTMSTWFWHKNWVWHCRWSRSYSWATGSKAPVFLVLAVSLLWFLGHAHKVFDKISERLWEVLLIYFGSWSFARAFCLHRVLSSAVILGFLTRF